MSIRFTAKARRRMVALTIAAGLAVGVAGCGGGGDDKKPEASASASRSSGSGASTQEGSDEPVAELKGEDGLVLQIASVQRDSGGFLTVSGEMKNDGT